MRDIRRAFNIEQFAVSHTYRKIVLVRTISPVAIRTKGSDKKTRFLTLRPYAALDFMWVVDEEEDISSWQTYRVVSTLRISCNTANAANRAVAPANADRATDRTGTPIGARAQSCALAMSARPSP
jgi:hypothetical protein